MTEFLWGVVTGGVVFIASFTVVSVILMTCGRPR